MSTDNPKDTPPTPAGAQAAPPAAPPPGSVTMDQVIEGLAACLEILEGKCDEKRERQLRSQITIGSTVIRQIIERKLILVAPSQIMPQGNRKQRRVAAAKGRRKG